MSQISFPIPAMTNSNGDTKPSDLDLASLPIPTLVRSPPVQTNAQALSALLHANASTHSQLPLLMPPLLQPSTSEPYRNISTTFATQSTNHYYDNILPQAQLLAQSSGMTIQEAVYKVNPNEEEDKWTRCLIEPTDLLVGDEIISDQIQITCNAKQPQGRYYDTIAMIYSDKTFIGSVVYNNKVLLFGNKQICNHSGDILLSKDNVGWLRHIVTPNFDNLRLINKLRIFIVSAGWISGVKEQVSKYVDLNPVFELRSTETNGSLKRNVIAQKLEAGGEFTALISGEIKLTDDGKWKTQVMEVFSDGFAGNIAPIQATLATWIENH
jgi:hypothetical protein